MGAAVAVATPSSRVLPLLLPPRGGDGLVGSGEEFLLAMTRPASRAAAGRIGSFASE